MASSCSTTTHRVAANLQVAQGVDQSLVVARMQPDRRLVKYVTHPHQPRSQAGHQPHSLQFAAAERVRGAIERQVGQPHAVEEFQPGDDLAYDRPGESARSRPGRKSSANARQASATFMAVTWWMGRPPINTAPGFPLATGPRRNRNTPAGRGRWPTAVGWSCWRWTCIPSPATPTRRKTASHRRGRTAGEPPAQASPAGCSSGSRSRP